MSGYFSRLCVLVSALMLSTSVANAEMMKVGGLREGDTLNVRTGAGANFTDIGDLRSGAIVNVNGVDSSGKWGQIVYRGQVAYVAMRYLQDVMRPDGSATGTGQFRVTGIKAGDPDGGLVIRAGAGADFAALGVLSNGEAIHVIQRSPDGKWAMIALATQVGWVSTAYLSETNPHGPAQPQPMPAQGAQNGPDGMPVPAVYSVTHVTADDVLWVRAEPDASSTPVNALAPDAPVSVIAMASPRWAKVTVGQTVGYVNAAYLTRGGGVTTSSGLQMNLICRGTEPFWTLEIAADRSVNYTMMGGSEQTSALNQASPSAMTGGYPYTIAAQPVSGIIDQRMCSDGMSDIVYPWSIVLNAPNEAGNMMTAHGCCTLR
jgi:uncharacterized protein YgiM (DUF1202 family)